MIEITSNDIAELNDEDLRSLVGRLCEAELGVRGLSTSAVTWGGNQNAADGGIDVRVKIEDGKAPGGFIPRTKIGFQVKKTDFTPGLIGPEMRPSDQLRPSISELIEEEGSYIIASSGSDTSDSALTSRLTAMRSAVEEHSGHERLHLDFYDRNRLATWTRNHPGLVLWARQSIGSSIPGWQSYGAWAVSPDGERDEYLVDDNARLHMGIADEKGVDVTQGIERIRDILRQPRKVVRLAGLSGVGKTRLVQALFDERVSGKPLNPALVVYTDMNDNPSPQPTAMISDLIALRTHAIVVVDNCAPDLHRRLTEICQTSDSLISAITVEYDVQEDEPEGTDVFRLEPSSVELVTSLIARRYPTMLRPSLDRIADFSGGNARIALVLAKTLERNESVAGLHDEELFKRLFHQRQGLDNSLLEAAQACALVYSFQGEALSGDCAELPKIATLVGLDARQLFAKVAELRRRDLVQCRSVWRAVLPQAIANRLAAMALRQIPSELIEQQFDTERLLKSFTRRLGYLHESAEAKHIAEKWLDNGGLLADIVQLTELRLAMFENIASVSPEVTLATIEKALSGPCANSLINDKWIRDRIATILQLIAYDASFFDRCISALIPLACAEQSGNHSPPVGDALKSLFHIIYSGTHATIEQRSSIVQGFLQSTESQERALGLNLLEALIETDNLMPSHLSEFGARVRDYGYWPRSREERAKWYETVLQVARLFASTSHENVLTVRSIIADSIFRLWFLETEVQVQFEAIAVEIAANGYWQEGWIAVRHLLSHLDEEQMKETAAVKRLQDFETRLRPQNIEERVRVIVLSQKWGALDYSDLGVGDDTEPDEPLDGHERADVAAEELGKEIFGDQAAYGALLPELVKGCTNRLYFFGRGLAIASGDYRKLWNQLVEAFINTEEAKRNCDVLRGFLNGLSTIDQPLCEALLDEVLTHPTLGGWFPYLQSSVTVTPAGADRLKKAATLGIARPGAFRFLGRERTADAMTALDLQNIVKSVAILKHGYEAAIDILTMRFHSERKEAKELPPELVQAGRELLSSPDFDVHDNSFDYHLHTVANVCLRGEEGSDVAKSLCELIHQGLMDHTFRPYKFTELLKSIFKFQARTALDVFFGSDAEPGRIDFARQAVDRSNPVDATPTEEILNWCDEVPAVRYSAVSHVVSYSCPGEEGLEWTPLALEMLRRAPDPLTVLETFAGRFRPMSWSGSRAAIIESRLRLLDGLGILNNPSLEDYATKTRSQLVEEITKEREREDERDRAQDERFE